MSDRTDLPAPIEAIVRAVGGNLPADDDERASTFARGLALGALVGAAIAGSAIWQRRLAKGRENEVVTVAAPSPDGDADPA